MPTYMTIVYIEGLGLVWTYLRAHIHDQRVDHGDVVAHTRIVGHLKREGRGKLTETVYKNSKKTHKKKLCKFQQKNCYKYIEYIRNKITGSNC